jgi:hypothetical protein
VLVILAAIIVIALLCFKLVNAINYSSFYDIAEDEFYIPGLMDGFVPQGFEYMEEEKVFLVCGYMSNGEDASRVYVIDEDGDHFYYTELTMSYTKTKYTGHTGGVAYYSDFLYISGSDGIDVFSLKDVMDESVASTPILGTVDTTAYNLDPAFCTVYEDQLFVGNFYDGEDYKAHENHKLKVEGRDENNAILLSFSLLSAYKDSERYGIAPQPNALYSIPDKAQGVCIIPEVRNANGEVTQSAKLAISTSFGISSSNILFHDFEKITENTYSSAKDMIGVENVPLYVVDSKTLVDTVEAPPMSEEIVYHDGKIWIMNESASNKYIFGKFTTGNYLYSFEYPLVKK